jgi:hypothetical protein
MRPMQRVRRRGGRARGMLSATSRREAAPSGGGESHLGVRGATMASGPCPWQRWQQRRVRGGTSSTPAVGPLIAVSTTVATRSSGPILRSAGLWGCWPDSSVGVVPARLQDGSCPICALVFATAAVRHFGDIPWRAVVGHYLHRPGRLRRRTVTTAESPTCHCALPRRQRHQTRSKILL